MSSRLDISHEELLALLHYEPSTGILTWRVRRNWKTPAGSVAGSKHPSGHVCLNVCNVPSVKAHRLIWFYMTGSWPAGHIDHINRIRDDNRWSNLRDVDQTTNNRNRDFSGVRRRGNRFEARITTDGITTVIGSFESESEAVAARLEAKRIHHPIGEIMNEVALTPAASAIAAEVAIQAEVRSITVTGPDLQKLLDAVSVDLEVVPQMEIDSADMEAELRQSLGRLATVSAAIEDERKERKAPVLAVAQWLDTGYNTPKSHVDSIIAAGKRKLNDWAQAERARIAREQEEARAKAQLAAAAAAAEEAKALAAANATIASAQQAREAGSEQVAQALESQGMAAIDTARQSAAQAAAMAFARPVINAKAPKAPGVTWKAECTDKAALIAHIGAMCAKGDKSLLNLLEIDPKAINALAKLQEANLNVPGLRAYTEGKAVRVAKQAVATV